MNTDLRKVLNTFRLDRLKRSLTHPMQFRQSQELLEIIHRRLQGDVRPVRIVTSGGSAVEGRDAGYQHWTRPPRRFNFRPGAWPSMWENLLNRAWPLEDTTGEEPRESNNSDTAAPVNWVEVANMASAAARSTTGALMLRSSFWPSEWGPTGPDLVVGAHAVNDFIGLNREADLMKHTTQVYMEDLLQSANKVRPCYNETSLPAILLLDDYIGGSGIEDVQENPYTISSYHRLVAQLSGWYQVGAVSYANVVRHLVTTVQPPVNEYGDNPFTHDKMTVHPGAVVHATMPVVLTYYLLSNLWRSCMEEPFMTDSNNSNRSTNTGDRAENTEFREEFEIKAIPELVDRRGLNNTRKDGLLAIWRANQNDLDEKCRAMASIDANLFPCTYSWVTMKNPLGIKTTKQLDAEMAKILVDEVDGWQTEGYRNKRPRPGWIATKAKAYFHIEVTATTVPIKYMTMMSMRSYGEKWANATVKVTLEVVRKGENSSSAINATPHFVSGYHSELTSILVPHTFEVPNGGAKIGDKVRTNFVLVGGTTFRIQGLLYCITK